ncbi:MAG: DEAD/DEAH box helicase, partial [Fimbriimonadales bacterium]|nr:DEAD/DEAH box helicase [Fimbriimonadales bacterium]
DVYKRQFPLPTVEDVSNFTSAELLWNAARLTLREGAAPFRSLGRISIRPRTYQFVPLLMALRLDPVRLLIADDVGVGKTIEALLIARELWDRGEIQRLCVLCPPYLCDQWQKELSEKFNLDAVVIRSGTVSRLESQKTDPNRTIYQYYPVQVISIDFVKTERNRHLFLQSPPEFVIVDEAHGVASDEHNRTQHERHTLVRELARDERRHLVLLTATPHSGIESAFRSLLSLLKPEFGEWNFEALTEEQRAELARHFVQRTRADILRDWEGQHCFPERQSHDAPYDLSPAYQKLFERTYAFCSEIVKSGEGLREPQRRVRYWGALALLRCVMSSPAAAVAALEARSATLATPDDDDVAYRVIYESADDRTDDETPIPPLEATEATLPPSERRQLHELRHLAHSLLGTEGDTKLVMCRTQVCSLVEEGFHPIVWCRYVATAEYLGEQLRRTLADTVQVVTITGRMGDDERKAMVESIAADRPRVLVATDCLSEGINLQDKFTAVVHYDLPWNPNRLEQREGRVDRYGQSAPVVKAIRLFGRNNPIDGVVIRVLLDKAKQIHNALGTYVPVPEESESVMEAVLQALFFRSHGRGEQLTLGLEIPAVVEFHRRWDRDVERERINRTRFAQRALKPEGVQRELEATDAVLGDPEAVRTFVLAAAERMGLPITADSTEGVYTVAVAEGALATVPEPVRLVLPPGRGGSWKISFDSPTPAGAEYIGRNHRLVTTLARFLLEQALSRPKDARVSRCGALRTRAVEWRTTALLLRVRYLLEQPAHTPMLAEEVRVLAYTEQHGIPQFLDDHEALHLLRSAKPDANIPLEEKRELVRQALDQWHALQPQIEARVRQRAEQLQESHKRIRSTVGMGVRQLRVVPQKPVDLLGVVVFQPVVTP